jgi:hypothetical protein
VSEVDLVQVEVEDFLLRKALFDPLREDHFPDFSSELPLRTEQQALDHLLGDGARALFDLAAGADVHPRSAQDRAVVDPRVFEKRAVLARHEREHEVWRHGFQRQERAPLFEELADHLAIAIEDAACDRRAVILDRAQVWKISNECEVECDRASDADHDE